MPITVSHSARDDDAETRADFARWFIDRDQIDEAARLLEPGDQLMLGRSDFQDLAAALARRGLGATWENRLVVVQPSAGAVLARTTATSSLSGDLAASARKPPLRGSAATAGSDASKKSA